MHSRTLYPFVGGEAMTPAVFAGRFPRLFAQQAAEAPDRIALVAADRSLTYGQLDGSSNWLAARLRLRGVKRNSVVALRLPRGPELVAAMLAVLKAGGVCLPLDPAYPEERSRFILRDAAPSVVLCAGDCAAFAPKPVIDLTGTLERSAEPVEPLQESPDDLAFLLYTSGSTGTPKGVMITADGRARRQAWTQQRYGATAADRHLLKSPVGFATLIREVFWPLTTGGCAVVARPEGHRDCAYLTQLIREERVSIANLVPSLLREMLEEPRIEDCASLRRVFATGEALTVELQRRFFEKLPSASLHLFYGSTEAPTSCFWDFRRDDPSPILTAGKPADVPVYLLDEQSKPVADGEPGEIYIGGPDLASGYYRRPDLTRERFVPDSFSADPDARLFRTGDRARQTPDGRLEFLGRLDDQVKIRGARVELGEVVSALRAHPAVRDAAVLLVEERLVAFHVPLGIAPLPAELRGYLADRLPEFMLPDRFVALERLPANVHGKLDREALARLVPAREQSVFAAETTLAAIWRRVLGVSSVEPCDNFFHLGGHSVAAMRVAASARAELGIELPVGAIFRYPVLRDLEAQLGGTAARALPLQTVPSPSTELPFTPAQRRLWFLYRANPLSAAYNVTSLHEILGPLNVDALRRSLDYLVARHPFLSSRIEVRDGEPRHIIGAPAPVTLQIVEGYAGEPIAEFCDRPRDLASVPRLEALLVAQAPERNLLALVLPHFICDGMSRRLIHAELSAIYAALSAERQPELPPAPPPLPPEPSLPGKSLGSLEFWKDRFCPPPPLTVVPGSVPLNLALSAANFDVAGRELRTLPPGLVKALRSLAARQEATLFAVLLTAFSILISRLARSQEIVVGVPVDCRQDAEDERRVGCFVNMLPFRIDAAGRLSCCDLLQQVKHFSLDALTHSTVPFERLVEAINPPRSPKRNPLFEIAFNFFASSGETLSFSGAAVRRLDSPESGAKFDLNFHAVEGPDSLAIKLIFRQALYRGDWAAAVLEEFETLLEQIAADPNLLVRQYSLVAPSYRRWMPCLAEPPERAAYEPVLAAFHRNADSHPERIAVDFETGAWIYSALRAAAAAVARMLRRHDLRPGETVAVLANPSAMLIACVLGILEAGGVFLLIDETLPELRQKVMMETAHSRLLVRVGAASAPKQLQIEQLQIEQLQVERMAGSPASPASGCNSAMPVPDDQPACIFFTSGSTGAPRAILFGQQGIAHFLDWERRQLGVGTEDRVALLTRLSFDAVLRDMFLPLVSGATLVIPPAGQDATPSELPRWLAAQRISLIHTVPAVAQTWLSSLVRPTPLPNLRYVLFSGEPLSSAFLLRWRHGFPSRAREINLYGSTETTMCKCFHEIRAEPAPGPQPAGRPLPGTEVFVVSPEGRLCGMGEPGEIVVRTAYRTFGYLNEPHAAFTANPARPGDSTDLLYPTGDLGRLLPDGNLEVMGRLDRQVKVRGVRVEPGEIEAALLAIPAVAEAAVIPYAELSGDLALAAFVAFAPAVALETSSLAAQLRATLPSFLVPARFVVVPQLPKTASGKVDRAALVVPGRTAVEGSVSVPPRNSLEAQLVEIWEQLLPIRPIGIRDNFFELGGHSLLSLQLLSRCERLVGRRVPLSALLPEATIEFLARSLLENASTAWSHLAPIRVGKGDTVLFCVHPAGGSALCYLELARALAPELGVTGVQGADPQSDDDPCEDARALAARYVAAIREAQPHGPYRLAGYSFGGLIAFEMGQQLHAAGLPVDVVALLDAGFPQAGFPQFDGLPERDGIVHDISAVLERHDLSAEPSGRETQFQLWRDLLQLTRKYPVRDRLAPGRSPRTDLGAVQELFRAYRLLPAGEEIDYAEIRRFLKILRANFRAARAYQPEPTLNRIVIFEAQSALPASRSVRPQEPPEQEPPAQEPPEQELPEPCGCASLWTTVAAGGYEIFRIPANHLNLLSPPAVDLLAAHLRRAIHP